jgi:hypothetical protein
LRFIINITWRFIISITRVNTITVVFVVVVFYVQFATPLKTQLIV